MYIKTAAIKRHLSGVFIASNCFEWEQVIILTFTHRSQKHNIQSQSFALFQLMRHFSISEWSFISAFSIKKSRKVKRHFTKLSTLALALLYLTSNILHWQPHSPIPKATTINVYTHAKSIKAQHLNDFEFRWFFFSVYLIVTSSLFVMSNRHWKHQHKIGSHYNHRVQIATARKNQYFWPKMDENVRWVYLSLSGAKRLRPISNANENAR